MILSIRFGFRLVIAVAVAVAVAVVGVAGVGASIAMGSTGQGISTLTVTRAVKTTTKLPGVPALVAKDGPKAGRYVTRPSSFYFIYGYRSDVGASHLTWVDWGQPVAFATGDILVQTSSGRFQSVPGAVVLSGLIACGTKPTYYYKSATAYLPTYAKYTVVSTGRPQLASPC
jgi:hypothetical protein